MSYKVIGIDISKETFDVSFSEKNGKWIFYKFSNDKNGFKKLQKLVDKNTIVVMEASGPYYLHLATYLYKNNVPVSVVNPLVIKHFSRMQMNRAKTDKIDAKIIAKYAMMTKPKLWKPKPVVLLKMQQIMTLTDYYEKALTGLKNQLEAFKATKINNQTLFKSLNSSIEFLQKQIKQLNDKLQKTAEKHYKENLELIKSIPGIGYKTAIAAIVLTDNFEKFDNYKQFIAYVGFSPRIYQSGTSVNGKGHICKLGNAKLRKLFYVCSWIAKRYNKSAINLYERLKEKGKPEKVIKVAIANKLIKIMFAVVKNKKMYDPNYEPVLNNSYA